MLAFDPGATRCGWAVVEKGKSDGYTYFDSGILGLARDVIGKEPYQAYRLRLIPYWVEHTADLLEEFEPDRVVTEIVPAVGGGNFVVATQGQLAGTVATVIQVVATINGVETTQLSAATTKRKIGGVKDASKVKVRNGVLATFPHLEFRRSEWVKVFDESDAIALGLCELGHAV